MKRIFLFVSFALAAFVPARADSCNTWLMDGPADPVLLRVTGADNLHFADCPDRKCSGRPYVMTGDLLIGGPRQGEWICTVFPNKGGGTTGWLPAARLESVPIERNAPPGAWAGKWTMHRDANLEITVQGGFLSVSGEAFWQGANPDNVHDGELEGKGRPANGVLALRDSPDAYACAATLRLVGPYLVVQDNMKCGGINVSFTGVYRKK